MEPGAEESRSVQRSTPTVSRVAPTRWVNQCVTLEPKEDVLEEQFLVNWLTATEVKTTLDQRRRKPMMQGAGRTSVASRASETCPVPLTRLRLNDLRLGRAFYRRRCGTAPA